MGGGSESLWIEGWTHEIYFDVFERVLCKDHTDYILEKLSITQEQFNDPSKREPIF